MGLSDYRREVWMENAPLGEGCYGYLLDKHPHGGGAHNDMGHHVGLPSCNRCDYFIFERGAVSFIEIKDVAGVKDTIKKKYGYIPWDKDTDGKIAQKLFDQHIAESCVLKLYGSMVVLCWFARCCGITAKNLRARKYKFWLVVESKNHDVRMLESMRLSLLENLKSRIIGVSSGFVADVSVMNRELLRKKIESDAVLPD